jgi:hypothetical protein
VIESTVNAREGAARAGQQVVVCDCKDPVGRCVFGRVDVPGKCCRVGACVRLAIRWTSRYSAGRTAGSVNALAAVITVAAS